MEQKQNELPEAAFDPVQAENICLDGCPYLGLRSDPSTSLAFPNEANQCHKLGMPAGIELAHQSGFCLSGQHKSCYIYVQPVAQTSSTESNKARFSLALPALAFPSLRPRLDTLKPRLALPAFALPSLRPRLDALKPRLALPAFALPSLKPRKDALKLRLLSLKLSLLLFKLRLLSLLPSRASVKQSLSPLEENLPKLKENFQSLNLDVDSLKNRIPSAKISQALNKINVQSLNQQNVRLLALPLMLLLILAAAVIWWPPPGGSERDALVMGASIAGDAAGSSVEVHPEIASSTAINQPQSGRDAALPQEAAAPLLKAPDREAKDQSVATDAEKDVFAEDDQESLAASIDALKLASPAAGDSNTVEEAAVEPLAGPGNSAVAADQAVVEPQQTEANAVAGYEQEEVPGAIAPEQLEQDEAESAAAVENDGQEPNDAPQTAAASDILTVAAIASIGPVVNELSLQELYETPSPLYVHLAPGSGTEVVAQVIEQQPATILGRDSGAEWLLVRLAGGIEGWVNAAESGAGIIVSNLPAVDGGAGTVTELAAGSPASEAGALPVLATAVVNIGALNVRSGPGLDYDPIGIVYNKQQVSLLEQPGSNVWIQVLLPDGQQGWLNSNYLILAS